MVATKTKPIDLPETRETKLSDPGPKPELKWIKLTELFIDQEYQRGTKTAASRTNMAYLQGNFSWDNCGALIVCHIPEKKQYAVIDGQHRLQAARARGDILELPCTVTKGLSFQRQAKSFMAVNTKRVQLNSLAAFHAAVAAGDDSAVSVKALLDACNVEIPRYPVAAAFIGPRQMQSPGTLLKMLDRYSANQMKWALTVIPEAFGDQRGQLRSMLIKVLAEFIKTNPDADRARMVRVLAKVDQAKLEHDAKASVRIGGGTTVAVVGEAIARLYKNAGAVIGGTNSAHQVAPPPGCLQPKAARTQTAPFRGAWCRGTQGEGLKGTVWTQ